MNEEIVKKIFEIVKHSNGIKAKAIAKRLNISRKEVNMILYVRLTKLCVRDEQYLWHLHPEYSSEKTTYSDSCFTKIEEAFSDIDFTAEELEEFLNNVEKQQN